ncbi:hypothetical protein PAXRUDRAFT_27801 [Paxillus rubicundulus Ve08.2h10]|uniref:Uncharacterized protein n=1 Tax=Paxillus rubicundulus Ve08.2h10 TaxID=930991 RepID=A0A0D0D0Y6_9AGAM|nr:hypothetical protein PAXRUDRAFT_27801 [Paxillus rubicundulus Ve08.2h10]
MLKKNSVLTKASIAGLPPIQLVTDIIARLWVEYWIKQVIGLKRVELENRVLINRIIGEIVIKQERQLGCSTCGDDDCAMHECMLCQRLLSPDFKGWTFSALETNDEALGMLTKEMTEAIREDSVVKALKEEKAGKSLKKRKAVKKTKGN